MHFTQHGGQKVLLEHLNTKQANSLVSSNKLKKIIPTHVSVDIDYRIKAIHNWLRVDRHLKQPTGCVYVAQCQSCFNISKKTKVTEKFVKANCFSRAVLKSWKGSLWPFYRPGGVKPMLDCCRVVCATKVYKFGVRMCVLLMSHTILNCNKRTLRFKDASWHDTPIKRAGQGQHTLERLLSTHQSWSLLLKDKAWRAGESSQSFNLCVLVSSFEILTEALSLSASKSE